MKAQAVSWPLKFQIGARTVLAVRRRLVRVPLLLSDVLAARAPALPMLPDDAHGYAIMSLPVEHAAKVMAASQRMIAFERQRYTRYYADLSGDFDGWFGGLSSNARSGLKRKAKKIAAASGGVLKIGRYRTAAELEAFHPLARRISERTYQERLMGAGLPDTPAFHRQMVAGAAAGQVRAWLLWIGDDLAAYLYCPIQGGDVIYEYVGHDPAFNEQSPGSVLQMEAMRDLFAEGGLWHFDFTEGQGQHKRQMATAGVECVDLLLLRPTLANGAVMIALKTFDASVAGAKATVSRMGLEGLAKRVRRG